MEEIIDDVDPLIGEVLKLLDDPSSGPIAIIPLQIKFGIGYSRATRLLKQIDFERKDIAQGKDPLEHRVSAIVSSPDFLDMAKIHYIRSRLDIGYNRAKRLLEAACSQQQGGGA